MACRACSTCLYAYLMHVCVHACTHFCLYAHLYTCPSRHVSKLAHACMQARTHAQEHAQEHARIHARTHAHATTAHYSLPHTPSTQAMRSACLLDGAVPSPANPGARPPCLRSGYCRGLSLAIRPTAQNVVCAMAPTTAVIDKRRPPAPALRGPVPIT